MSAFLKILSAGAAALALSGCVIVAADGDWDDWDDHDGDWQDSGSAYLMVPYSALEAYEGQHLFFHNVLPELSLTADLSNAGTEDYPWYCFEFDSTVDAEYARRRIQAMENGDALARHILINDYCAAG